jgi:hypothetical protein
LIIAPLAGLERPTTKKNGAGNDPSRVQRLDPKKTAPDGVGDDTKFCEQALKTER